MTIVCYGNIRDFKFELKEIRSTITPAQGTVVDDVQAYAFLRLASNRLTRKIGARFLPYLETKTFSERADQITGRKWRINARRGTLYLPEPLLALPTLVSDGDGAAMTYSTDYVEDSPGQYPITALRLTGNGYPCTFGCKAWYALCACPAGVVSQVQLTGIWGFHPDYANAYVDSLDTVRDNPLTDTARLIHVTNVGGADELGRTPRFTPGQLIKMGSELALVNTTDDTADTLGVTRGANGTTKASHVQGTSITIFEPDERIQQACLRLAGFIYKRRGSYESENSNDLGTTIKFPGDLPPEVAGLVQDLIDDIWGGTSI